MIEPGAAEDELPQPVHERLAAEHRDLVPAPVQVATERRARRRREAPGRRELHQIGALVIVQVAGVDELELDCGGRDALGEILRREPEAMTDELEVDVVSRAVVRIVHLRQDATVAGPSSRRCECPRSRCPTGPF